MLTEAGDGETLQWHVTLFVSTKSTLCDHLACLSVGHMTCPHTKLCKFTVLSFYIINKDAVYEGKVIRSLCLDSGLGKHHSLSPLLPYFIVV